MTELARRIAGLAGWRRRGLALLLGALAAAAQPPLLLVPLLVPAFVGLVWMIDGTARPRAAFALGWWFGVGYFAAGLYWIGLSMLVDAARYAWMIPFAVGGIAAGLALFIGLVAYAVRRSGATGAGRVLVLAAAWTAAEGVRGWILTGFPWNLVGQVWTVSDVMIQAAAVIGTYGLGLLTVLAAAMPAVLGDGGTAPGRRRAAVLLATLPLGLVAAGGALRLAAADAATVPGVRLRIVQPNVPQRLKWAPDRRAANVRQLLEMSRGGDGITHVVWPETAVPYLLASEPRIRAAIAAVVPPGGSVVTGAVRRVGEGRLANSLLAIDGRGNVAAVYDKAHLVPFGEYVPFRSILPIEKIVPNRGDFVPGPGRRTLTLAGLPPFSPLICFEAIFPAAVTDESAPPEWLLNITNDAWFGTSSGPYQHFAASRLRAVEEGLPLVRAANTGISGVVDAYGRVTARLGLGETGVLDVDLPAALAGRTPFARYGNAPAWGLALLSALAGLAARRRAPSSPGRP